MLNYNCLGLVLLNFILLKTKDKKMKAEEKMRTCRYCMYAFKNYFSVGHQIIFRNVSSCSLKKVALEMGDKFEERVNCKYFSRDRIPAPRNDMEQRLAYLSRKLDDIQDLVVEILEIIDPLEEGNTTQTTENNETDK